MTVTVVAHAAAGTAGAAGSTTAAIDTTGATLIVIGTVYDSAKNPTISDSKGNTWTALTSTDIGSGNGRTQLYYCLNPVVGLLHTFSSLQAASAASIAVIALSGTAGASAFDQQNAAVQNGAVSTKAVTWNTTAADEAIIAILNILVTDTPTLTAGWTREDTVAIVGGQHFGITLGFINQATATSGTLTWNWTTGSAVGTSIASFAVKAPAAAVLRPNPPQLIG